MARIKAEIIKKYGEHNILEVPASWPERKFEISMRKVVQRPGEKMDVLLGTSLEKALEYRSAIASSERVLVWSRLDRNWRAKIDSIKVDLSAGRFERGHFADLHRFRGDVGMMKNISEAVEKKLLKLTRIDASAVQPDLNPIYQRWYDHWVKCKVMGKDSMKLLKHGMWWIQQQRGQSLQEPDPPGHDGIMWSEDWKYVVYFGSPSLYALYRFGEVERRRTVRVCLIPHFKNAQTNELFVFERGEKWSRAKLDKLLTRSDLIGA